MLMRTWKRRRGLKKNDGRYFYDNYSNAINIINWFEMFSEVWVRMSFVYQEFNWEWLNEIVFQFSFEDQMLWFDVQFPVLLIEIVAHSIIFQIIWSYFRVGSRNVIILKYWLYSFSWLSHFCEDWCSFQPAYRFSLLLSHFWV